MLQLGIVDNEEDKYTYKQVSKRKNVLSQEEIYFWFIYDWEEGILKHRWARYLREDKVGWINKDGSKRFTLMGKIYSLSHTIYTLFFGEVPSDFIVDYKDGNPLNTRIENLFLRHYSFISRRSIDKPIEKEYTGVFYDENEGWRARFKGHSSFGSVSNTGPLRPTMELARLDYVRFKTSYLRGLFIWPLFSEDEKIYIDASKFLDSDMVALFNSLPIHSYQVKYVYKDPYLSAKVLPDKYSIGNGTNLNHPLFLKYFKKYSAVFKPRATHITAKEKQELIRLLNKTQSVLKLKETRNLGIDKVIGLLNYYSNVVSFWTDNEKILVNKAVRIQNLKKDLL